MPTLRRTPLILGSLLIGVALVVPAVAAASTTAAAGNGTLFKSACLANHEAMDDPIVFPGQPGASHMHVVFGNTTTNAFSTYASMIGRPATCRIAGDHAGYWIPALYANGTEILPRFANAYYLADGARGRIVPFPAGLKVIAGDSYATAPQSTSILGWKC